MTEFIDCFQDERCSRSGTSCEHIALFLHPISQTPNMKTPDAAFSSAQIHPLILPCRSPCFGSCCAKIPLPRQSVSTSLQTCHHSYNLLCQQNCKQAAWPVWITKQFMICFCSVQSFPLSFLSLRRNWCSQDTALTSQASPEPVPSVPHNPCWRGHLCH